MDGYVVGKVTNKRVQSEKFDPFGSVFVLQTALDDFYVRYELTVSVASSALRSEILDRLHGKVQDIFNENGVQIMSPHFLNQPPETVVVPKDRWHVPPEKPPA